MAVSWTPTNPFYHELILRYVQSGTATWEPEAPSNTCRNGCGRFLRHSHEFYSFLGADPQGLKASKFIFINNRQMHIWDSVLYPVSCREKKETWKFRKTLIDSPWFVWDVETMIPFIRNSKVFVPKILIPQFFTEIFQMDLRWAEGAHGRFESGNNSNIPLPWSSF